MFRLFIVLCTIAVVTGCGQKPVNENNSIAVNSSGYTELDSRGQGWGFVRRKGKEPEIPLSQITMLEKYNGFYLDKKGNKNLYLTFDEGYENGFTAVILDTLKKTNTPAAFFCTGPYLEGQTELVKRMIDEGHIVGNHTVNHLNLPKQVPETVKSEITMLNDRCNELYGYKMQYMRPPEGEFSERTLAITNDLGMKTIMWSFAYKDWDINAQRGADYAYESVMPYLHDGAIILLHAVSSDNASALERIINDAVSEGYTFKSLDEL
ncbi:MAG: polysaccharide deacetylase family protein [Clostridia bacterium]|jgi:peptidoglycan-N-acetylmuramic acid deacetylase|nr:polysaccharide deacetylase family protein [Clostridia bacterium]